MALTRPRATAATATPPAATPGDAGGRPGVGDAAGITVKGQPATAAQRATIDQCLQEARELGASNRVMVAVVMAITQESEAGNPALTRRGDAAGPDSRGPFQQRTAWGPLETRMDPAGSTRLFLTANKGHGVQGWKIVHGGLKNAPGDLSRAINKVQISQYPDAYARHQAEAERTVAAWTGTEGADFGTDARYDFTRGERGGARESSWEASGRLAEEVGWRRWAAGNVLYFASDQELRQAAPSLTIRGDEPWLLSRPAWDWGTGRAVAEVTLRVLADRWGVMPGGVVVLSTGGPIDGRWIVATVGGSRLDSREVTITLRRPTMRRPEPAAEQATADGDGAEVTGDGSGLLAAAKEISDEGRGYLYGGGHGPQLDSISDDAPLDCSSSTALALKRAGFFPGSVAIVSGAFATSWGQPGKGRNFTVWANATHVWIEFHGAPGGFVRFDTSPHGDSSGRGPRLRTTARNDQSSFTARHWPSQ